MIRGLIILLFSIYSFAQNQEPQAVNNFVANETTPLIKRDSIRKEYRVYTQISNEFDFKAIFEWHFTETEDFRDLTLYVIDKSNKRAVDTILLNTSYWFFGILQEQDTTPYRTNVVSSFSTKVNIEGISYEHPADIVIADFNFDGKDDIAIANEISMSGERYIYYIQQANQQFVIDTFLTNLMEFFPEEINSKNRTLITRVHVGACCESVWEYKLNKKRTKWHRKNHKWIDYIQQKADEQ